LLCFDVSLCFWEEFDNEIQWIFFLDEKHELKVL
jgi:hypothetical protein